MAAHLVSCSCKTGFPKSLFLFEPIRRVLLKVVCMKGTAVSKTTYLTKASLIHPDMGEVYTPREVVNRSDFTARSWRLRLEIVPTFRDGEVVVNESGAICMYLEENYSKDSIKLLPSDVNERAQVYQTMFESANVQSTVLEKVAYYRFMTKKEDVDEELDRANTIKAKEELLRWNTILGDNDYLCGNTFTMADVFFYPFLAFFIRGGAKLTDYPALLKYYDRVSARPSVQDTWPPHWKESEGQEILSDL